MHETRNLIIVLLLLVAAVWLLLVWIIIHPPFASGLSGGVWAQRWVALLIVAALGGATWYVLLIEDKLPDRLARAVGPVYYDVEGLSFMPTVRAKENGRAEICLYYQNRYENYCNAIVHMRPVNESFVVRPGMRDMHFSFKADGGDFGVIHQPIGVPRTIQGDVVELEVAAVVRYPRSHGSRLCSHEGMTCGTFNVDWGQAFKIGVHEVSGEIDLENPAILRLSMPINVKETVDGSAIWKQETLEPGPAGNAVLT